MRVHVISHNGRPIHATEALTSATSLVEAFMVNDTTTRWVQVSPLSWHPEGSGYNILASLIITSIEVQD